MIIGCPVKFSMAPQLYCHGECGKKWLDKEPGCQLSDAHAYCKLKFCDINAAAIGYETTKVWDQPGFSCDNKGFNFGTWFGIDNVAYSVNLQSSFDDSEEDAVVSNVKCRVSAERGISILLFKYGIFLNH